MDLCVGSELAVVLAHCLAVVLAHCLAVVLAPASLLAVSVAAISVAAGSVVLARVSCWHLCRSSLTVVLAVSPRVQASCTGVQLTKGHFTRHLSNSLSPSNKWWGSEL